MKTCFRKTVVASLIGLAFPSFVLANNFNFDTFLSSNSKVKYGGSDTVIVTRASSLDPVSIPLKAIDGIDACAHTLSSDKPGFSVVKTVVNGACNWSLVFSPSAGSPLGVVNFSLTDSYIDNKVPYNDPLVFSLVDTSQNALFQFVNTESVSEIGDLISFVQIGSEAPPGVIIEDLGNGSFSHYNTVKTVGKSLINGKTELVAKIGELTVVAKDGNSANATYTVNVSSSGEPFYLARGSILPNSLSSNALSGLVAGDKVSVYALRNQPAWGKKKAFFNIIDEATSSTIVSSQPVPVIWTPPDLSLEYVPTKHDPKSANVIETFNITYDNGSDAKASDFSANSMAGNQWEYRFQQNSPNTTSLPSLDSVTFKTLTIAGSPAGISMATQYYDSRTATSVNRVYSEYENKEFSIGVRPVYPANMKGFGFAQSVATYTVINNLPLGGTLSASANEGSIPYAQKVTLNQTADEALGTKLVNWYVSADNGTTWEKQLPTTNSFSFSPAKGGNYLVRAQITPYAVTKSPFFTESLGFVVHEAPKVSLSGETTVLPGTVVNVSASLFSAKGKADALDNYAINWSVYDQNNTLVNSATNQASISINTPTALSVSDKQEVGTLQAAGTYRVVMTARPKWMSENDIKSIATVEKLISFDVKAPSISVKTPMLIESGKTVFLSGTAVPSWDKTSKTSLVLVKRWTKDGVELGQGDRLSYTPPVGSPKNPVAHNDLIKFEAWVDGAKDSTFVSKDVNVPVFDYVLPSFTFKALADSTYAPANLRLSLNPSSVDDAKLMSGKKYTYTWKIPEGAAGVAKGNSSMSLINFPGDYNFTVTVEDNVGNKADFGYAATFIDMKPFEYTLETKPLLPFERSPMSYRLKPTLKLGHPKDIVTQWTLKVNGEVIGTPSAKIPALVTQLPEGNHNIELGFLTKFGVKGALEKAVTVAPNQAPTCTLSSVPVLRTTYKRVNAACKDVDGKLKSIKWTIDGTDSTKTSASIVVDMAGLNSSLVRITATDDSGDTGSAEITLTP